MKFFLIFLVWCFSLFVLHTSSRCPSISRSAAAAEHKPSNWNTCFVFFSQDTRNVSFPKCLCMRARGMAETIGCTHTSTGQPSYIECNYQRAIYFGFLYLFSFYIVFFPYTPSHVLFPYLAWVRNGCEFCTIEGSVEIHKRKGVEEWSIFSIEEKEKKIKLSERPPATHRQG